MKKLYYIFLLLVAFGSCKDNADYPFTGKDAVYFQLQTESYYWTKTLDSIVYSFAGKGVDQDTLWVRVNLAGEVAAEGRPVIVVVDEERTTAKVGLHYEALQPEYELPRDSVCVNIPVIIYNKDEEKIEPQEYKLEVPENVEKHTAILIHIIKILYRNI